MFKQLIRRILSVETLRNSMTLFSGTFFSQFIILLASPFLTRVYSPEVFGVFSVFLSVSMILASISTGKYELAIMLPKKNLDAFILLLSSIILSFCLNIIFFIIMYFFGDEVLYWIGVDTMSNSHLFYSPLLSFIVSFYLINQYWANRMKSYDVIAYSKVVQSVSLTFFQLTFSQMFSFLGLILGYALGQFFSSLILIKNNIIEFKSYFYKFNCFYALEVIKKYKKFPLYFNFSYGVNTFTLNLIPIVLMSSFGAESAGLYLLVQRAISLPVSMITTSIGNVFFQKATTQKDCRKLYLIISLGLFFSGLPLVIFLYFYSPFLFRYIFGDEWGMAGEMASILIIMYWISISTNPVSQFSTIHQKVLYNVLWQISFLCSILLAWYFGVRENDIFIFLSICVILQSALYILGYFYEYSLCVRQARE